MDVIDCLTEDGGTAPDPGHDPGKPPTPVPFLEESS